MKMLFLTNLFPYPLDNGGKIKTYSTLQALNKMGINVDLLCFSENIEADKKNKWKIEEVCNSIDLVEHKLTTKDNINKMLFVAFKSILCRYPYVVYKYKCKEMLFRIREHLLRNKYEYIYFDHLQMFIYYDLLSKHIGTTKKIIDQHNCESQIIERTVRNSNNIIKKLFLKLEYRKILKFEKRSLSSAEKVFILSKQDFEKMKSLGAKFRNASILPIAIIDNGLIEKKKICGEKVLTFIFVGTLTWNPNDKGICWFVDKVLPIIEQNNILYKLYIIGKNPSVELKRLCEDNANLIVTGYVEDVNEYYSKADVMIVPLFIGGGQRVKIIEAFSKGIPVISTSVGAEGLEYRDRENILIADNEMEFVEACKCIGCEQFRKNIAANGRKLYEEEYSLESYFIKYKEALHSVM